MPTRIKYYRNGSGVKKNDNDDWYNGIPIKNVQNLLDTFKEELNKKRTTSTVTKTFDELLKNIKTNLQFQALRIAVLQRIDEIDDTETALEFDKEIETKITRENKFNATFIGERKEIEKRGEKRKRKEDEPDENDAALKSQTLEGEESKDETEKTPPSSPSPSNMEIDLQENSKRKREDQQQDENDAALKNQTIGGDESEDEIKEMENRLDKDDESEDEIKEMENRLDTEDAQDEDAADGEITQDIQEQDNEQEGEEQEILPELELTHPNEIQEKELVIVHDPVETVNTNDNATLPDSVVPQGEESVPVSSSTILPEEFNAQQKDIANQLQQQELAKELDTNEIDDSYQQDLTIEETPPHSFYGFDNNDKPIIVESIPTEIESRDLFNSAIRSAIANYIDPDVKFESIDDLIDSTISKLYSDDDDEIIDQQDEQEQQDQVSIIANPPTEDEQQDVEMKEIEQEKEKEVEDIEMKPPTKQMIRAQEKSRKLQDEEFEKERKKYQQRQKIINEIHHREFGQKPTPMMTDELEAKIENEKEISQRVSEYLSKITAKTISDLTNVKKSFVGIIKQGQVLTEFYSNAQDAPKTSKQKEISKEIRQIGIRQAIEKAIHDKVLKTNAEIVAEVADFTAKNLEKIKARLDPKYAISKYIYPSYRDPDTFNIVKYASDSDGNVIINKATGFPIIESISAVDRDDTKRLLQQKQAVDATDTPSPYFPKYGKQARRFFSKLEYNYLGRMFQSPAGQPRISLPKPNNLPGRVQELLSEMGESLEIKDTSIDRKKLFKQWMELEVLRNAYQRYNQFSDYNYNQDKKELGQDGTLVDPDATESAAKILQNITVQKLLDLLSNQKKQEINVQNQTLDEQGNIDSLKDKQQTTIARGENEMDVENEPSQVGAEIPKEPETNLNLWALKSNPSFNVFDGQKESSFFIKRPFAAFGGQNDEEEQKTSENKIQSAWV
jgi:hypothetical protein